MKKVEKVSIGGYAFTLDTEAAVTAGSYLKDISDFYANPEISEGIEERMAELLRERVPSGGVVEKKTVEGVIAILGRPEKIAEDQPDGSMEAEKPVRKLYRDMDNARIAGVCSGLGAYFNFDPIILRVILTVLFVASCFSFVEFSGALMLISPLIYIILWICIPPARTAQQRWALRGDPGTAEGVRRNVEGGKVGAALKQVGRSPIWSTLGRILEISVGLLLLIISVSGLFAGALALFGWQLLGLGDLLSSAMIGIAEEFPQSSVIINTVGVKILAVAVYTLPLIGMLYGSIMLLFHIKSPSWRPGLWIFIIWIISVIAFTVLMFACLFSAVSIA